jgi:hypothetical protein
MHGMNNYTIGSVPQLELRRLLLHSLKLIICNHIIHNYDFYCNNSVVKIQRVLMGLK